MRVLFALLALAASVATVSAQGWTGPNFYIVGNDGTASYNFSINGVIVNNPSFNLTVGTTYKFILNASLPTHPFGFSGDNTATITMSNATGAANGGMTLSGSCILGTNQNPLSWQTSDVANPCIVSFTPPAGSAGQGAIYYRCSNHANMNGALTAVAAATTAPPTTPAPSGTGNGTTAPPTSTPAPAGSSSSSTGKGNGAAVIVPGAAVFLIAAINALFA